jgi:hypothetical protein
MPLIGNKAILIPLVDHPILSSVSVKSSGKDEFAALVDLSTPVPSLPALIF